VAIVDLPDKTKYHYEAFLCAGNALTTVFGIFETRLEASKSGILVEGGDRGAEYEQACQHLLKNALIFTQQAYEMYLRGLVCEVSAYLLVPEYQHWAERASQKDIRFSELKSVNASDLPKLCNAVRKEKLSHSITKNYWQLRELRNRLVHSTPEISVNRQILCKQIADIFGVLGWQNSVVAFSQYQAKSHVAVLYDPYIIENRNHSFIAAMRNELGEDYSDKTFLQIERSADAYCVHCYADFDLDYSDLDDFLKTAVLSSFGVNCGLCGGKSESIKLDNLRAAFFAAADVEGAIVTESDGSLIGYISENDFSLLRNQVLKREGQ
tara:strand:+ start:273 stop:1244 length:972 start_codon:yes stop_codon:yes gene_type:complete